MTFWWIDPLHIMGMQSIWRTKQKKFSLLGIEIYSHVKKIWLFCRPNWLHFHACARGLYKYKMQKLSGKSVKGDSVVVLNYHDDFWTRCFLVSLPWCTLLSITVDKLVLVASFKDYFKNFDKQTHHIGFWVHPSPPPSKEKHWSAIIHILRFLFVSIYYMYSSKWGEGGRKGGDYRSESMRGYPP